MNYKIKLTLFLVSYESLYIEKKKYSLFEGYSTRSAFNFSRLVKRSYIINM